MIHFIASQLDISDRKAAQEALRESEAHHRALFQSSRDAIVVLHGQQLVECNTSALCMFRCRDKEDLCGHVLLDFSPPQQPTCHESAAQLPEFIAEVVRDGTTYFEWTFCRPDRTELPCEVLLSLVEGGDVPIIQASIRNVSQRKKEQAKLRKSEERFRQLAENIDEVFWIADADTQNFIYISPAFEKIWGLPTADAYRNASAWTAAIHADDRAQVRARYDRGIAKGEFNLEYRLIRPDGSIRLIRDRGSSIRNAEGKIYRIVGVARDVTARKQYETAFRDAKLQAEEASQAKSQFLASMSHELRTPLNGVIGMTELLLSSELNDRQRQFAQACHTSGESLMQLINDILDFSKIEARRLELDCHEFDLEEVIASTADITRLKAHQKGVELICHLAHDALLRVRADSVRLRQVLVNLIGNATKFTEKGEIVVRVSVEGERNGQTLVRFEVTDTGIGVSPDGLQRLFQSFSQVDNSTTRKYGGTGLGLAISKSLVELMGGSLQVESTEGAGSVFFFVVPLDVVGRGEPKHKLITSDLRGQRVLIVDDNATNRMILQEHIDAWGMQAQASACVDDALAAVERADSDGAPLSAGVDRHANAEKNGLEFAEALKHRSDVSVILLGSCEAMPNMAQQESLRISLALQKPVKQSELFQAIVETLSDRVAVKPDEVDTVEVAPVLAEPAPSGQSILVVEDNEVNRMYIAESLERQGFDCAYAKTGVEALEAVRDRSFGLVLMDCQMPEMDGFEATRKIREMEANGTLPDHLPIVGAHCQRD